MPEEKVESAATEQAQTAETKVPTVEELVAQLESIKRAQAGSDKAYQEAARRAKELEAENEKLKKEKMSEKERAEFELAKQKAELEAKAREVAEATLRLSKMRLMSEKKLPVEYADLITGSNEEELIANMDRLNKAIDMVAAERMNEKLLSGKKPEAGVEKNKEAPKFSGGTLQEIEAAVRASIGK